MRPARHSGDASPIAERLAAAEPDRADYQRDLFGLPQQRGGPDEALGQGDDALARYRRARHRRAVGGCRDRTGPTTNATCRSPTAGWGT